MIQAAGLYVKSDHRSAVFFEIFFLSTQRCLLKSLTFATPSKSKTNFTAFVLFLEAKTQQTKIISHYISSIFISTMRSFDNSKTETSIESKIKAVGSKRRLLLTTERYFRSVESSSCRHRVVVENSMKDSPGDKHIRNKRDNGSVQGVDIIDLTILKYRPAQE